MPMRSLRWGLFALALACLGVALYAGLPHEPRWVLRGPIAPLGLTLDGTSLITAIERVADLPSKNRSPTMPFAGPQMGPIQFWDIATGQEVWSLLGENGPRWQVAFSDDYKRLVAVASPFEGADRDEMKCIDLTTGRERRTMIEHRTNSWNFVFSPGGTLLLLDDWDLQHDVKDLHLYDAVSLRLLVKAQPRNRWPRYLWSTGGNAMLIYATDENGNARLRRISADGETMIQLKGAGDWLAVTPDGKTLITEPPRPEAEELAPVDSLLLWDLPEGTQRGTIPVDAFHPRASGDNLIVTPDSRTLLITHGMPRPGNTIGVWDIETAQWLGKVVFDRRAALILPEHNAFALFDRENKRPNFTWYRIRPFAKLWEREWPGGELRSVDYLSGVQRLAVLWGDGSSTRVQLFETQSGAPTLEIKLDPGQQHQWLSRGEHFAVLSWDRDAAAERSALVLFIEEHIVGAIMPRLRPGRGTPTSTQFFDLATGSERGRIDRAGADPDILTPDGRTLLLYQQAGHDGDAAIFCYDVPPRRPWTLIAGIPLLAGAALVSLHFGWRRLRGRRATNSPVAESTGRR
jgi:hypothetical protein